MPPIPSDFSDTACYKNKWTHRDESYSTKRRLESDDISPASKKARNHSEYSASIHHTMGEPAQEVGSPVSCIVCANKGLSTDSYIKTFGSRANILPTVSGKHSDLNAVSSKTISAILEGHYDNQMTKVTIIDCRYPYEYEGGHIQGAINLYTKESVQQFLNQSVSSSVENHVLIFHCEFSS